MRKTVLDIFDVSLDFLTDVVVENPSLRGMVMGYIAERKLREGLQGHGRATAFRKDDDHDRKKKGDLVVTYQGFEFKIEVKSLQTHTIEIMNADPSIPGAVTWIRKMLKQRGRGMPNPAYLPVWDKYRLNGRYRWECQCDASDKRRVTFPDKSTLETTNLLFGEFDIFAAGLFSFREKWDHAFGFVLNRDLPHAKGKKYTEYQREHLIDGMIAVTWPLTPPFETDIYVLLDKLVAERKAGVATKEAVVVEEKAKIITEVKEVEHLKVIQRKPRKKS